MDSRRRIKIDAERSSPFQETLRTAWDLSREYHGSVISFHVPGMFVVDGRRGRYRAVSITGARCDLDCGHCKGKLLETMAHAPEPEDLVRIGLEAAQRGDHGMLITGGCDRFGRLPWREFLPAIARLKTETDLILTVHAGQVDRETARSLKSGGVDQALVDVMGDDETVKRVYRLDEGTAVIRRTLDALADAGVETVPHILFGIYYGEERAECEALEILRNYPLRKYVVVVLMPFLGTPMEGVSAPPPERVAEFLAGARIALPTVKASLGCARPRGRYRRRLDPLAVRAGVNVMALPSDAAVDEARALGLSVEFRETCCSLG